MLIERYRRWFDHEKHAHDQVFDALATVPESRRDSPEFRRACAILGHIVAARRMWLYRLGQTPHPPAALFLETADPASVRADWDEVSPLWDRYLSSLSDPDLDALFDYRAVDGSAFRSRIEDVFTQLLTHSPYHRGQIALLLRSSGGQPPTTDFIYWTRESLA